MEVLEKYLDGVVEEDNNKINTMKVSISNLQTEKRHANEEISISRKIEKVLKKDKKDMKQKLKEKEVQVKELQIRVYEMEMQVEDYKEVTQKCDAMDSIKYELEGRTEKLNNDNKEANSRLKAVKQEIIKLESAQRRLNKALEECKAAKVANEILEKKQIKRGKLQKD